MLTIGLTSFILSGCELVPLDENIESAVLERESRLQARAAPLTVAGSDSSEEHLNHSYLLSRHWHHAAQTHRSGDWLS